MRFAVMGAGEIGSRYGARLALHGHDVTFIARGARLAQLQNEGLHVPGTTQGPEQSVAEVNATDNVSDMQPVDSVIFAVKNYQLEAAAELIRPIIGPETTVVPLQNGIDAPRKTGEILGRKHVLGFATWNPAAIGELDGPVSPRVKELHDVFNTAGWAVQAVDDIWYPLWMKLCAYASFSPFIVTRLSSADSYKTPELVELHQAACREVAAVGQAEGIDVDADVIIEFGIKAGDFKQSMTRDLEIGRPLELEDLIGTVVHKAEEHGIEVPVVRNCYQLLKPHEHGK